MSRRRSEENIIDVRARLGHNVDQRNSDILGATTESARVGRSAGVFTTAMAITGLVWGLTLAIWATSPGADGTRAGMPVQGWFGCLLIGLLYAMGVTVILIIPVVLMAALLGGARPAEEPTHRWWGRRGSDGSSWSSWSLCPHLGLVCGGGGLMASRCDSQCIGMLVGAMGDGGAKFTIKL